MFRGMRRASISSLFALSLFAIAASANAAIINPGDTSSPVDTLFTSTGPFIGNTGVQNWSTGVASGIYQEVVIPDANNVFCPGCLDFVFVVSNDATSTDSLRRLTLS